MTNSLADLDLETLTAERAGPARPLLMPGAWVVNEWAPTADPDWQRILDDLAGRNLYGDPMLRIVNGSSRLELVGGLWENVEAEDAGLPRLRYQWDQKFPWLEDFWFVEEWVPTRVSREAWEAAERKWEDGLSYLSRPIYPSRGEYRFFRHFRKKGQDGEETPARPTTTGLRMLASWWARLRSLTPPDDEDSAGREKRIAENLLAARAKREFQEIKAKAAKRDIFYNEVGGMTGLTPNVSLAGLEIPGA